MTCWDWTNESGEGHEVNTTWINILELLSVLPTVCNPENWSSMVAQANHNIFLLFNSCGSTHPGLFHHHSAYVVYVEVDYISSLGKICMAQLVLGSKEYREDKRFDSVLMFLNGKTTWHVWISYWIPSHIEFYSHREERRRDELKVKSRTLRGQCQQCGQRCNQHFCLLTHSQGSYQQPDTENPQRSHPTEKAS